MASPFGDVVVPQKYRATVATAAAQYGVPAELLARQIDAESSFNEASVSPDGAIGISQFMPETAKSLGLDPHDPVASIKAQAKLMSYYFKKYGSWEKALYAYHDGPGKVDSPGPAGIAYAKKILGGLGNAGDLVAGIAESVNPFTGIEKVVKAFSDSGKWIRVGFYLLGLSLVVVGVLMLAGPKIQEVAKSAGGKG